MEKLVSDKTGVATGKPPVVPLASVKSNTMKALVYHGPGKKTCEQVPMTVML